MFVLFNVVDQFMRKPVSVMWDEGPYRITASIDLSFTCGFHMGKGLLHHIWKLVKHTVLADAWTESVDYSE